jgi:hypothetical protein
MKKILLTLVVKNSRSGNEAEIIKHELQKKLPSRNLFISMNKYQKFRNSFMLDFAIPISSRSSAEKKIFKMLEVSSLIARPWLAYFDADCPELILNNTKNTVFKLKKFDAIFWGHIQIS